MLVEIWSHITSKDVASTLKQLESTYAATVIRMAAERDPFAGFETLHISPEAFHPLSTMSSKLSRSFHGPTKTYFVSTPLNYLNVASTDWDIRVTAYADGIMQAILHVAKSKLN